MGKGSELATRLNDLAKSLGIPVGLVESADAAATNEEILAELIGQGSLEGVLGAGQVEALEDFVGTTLRFESVKWQPSTVAGKAEDDPTRDWPYAVITATDMVGVKHVLTCGAGKVVIALAYARKDGGFPFEARVVSNETSAGYRVLSLAAPQPKG